MTLYMYYPACDAMVRSMCTIVVWHIWWRYVWHIIYGVCMLYFPAQCMSLTSLSTQWHTFRTSVNSFKFLYFKVCNEPSIDSITFNLVLNYCSMVHNYIIIIIIKKYWQCKAGRGRLTPYQSEDPSPTRPTNRGNEEKEKIVEDKRGEDN